MTRVRGELYGDRVLASVATDWVGAVGAVAGPFVGVLGALWIYSKRLRHDETSARREKLEAVFLQLRTELDANRRIVVRSIETIETVLSEQAPTMEANDPIHDERLYLAPLFADSWKALVQTDAHRLVPRTQLDHLFEYYAAIARANWLIERVQRFQFREPILEEIAGTLRQVQDPKAGVTVDLVALGQVLAPGLAAA